MQASITFEVILLYRASYNGINVQYPAQKEKAISSFLPISTVL